MNFKDLLYYNGSKLPFAAAQVRWRGSGGQHCRLRAVVVASNRSAGMRLLAATQLVLHLACKRGPLFSALFPSAADRQQLP